MADQTRWGEGRYQDRYEDRYEDRYGERRRADDYPTEDSRRYRDQERYRSSEPGQYGARARYGEDRGDSRSRPDEDRSFDHGYRYGGGYDPYRSANSRAGDEAYRERYHGASRSREEDYRPPNDRAAADFMMHRPPYERAREDRSSDWYRSDYQRGGETYGRRGDRDQRDGPGERTAWDRTRDQLASWFGDQEAARRTELDQRRMDDHHGGKGPKNYARSDSRIQEDVNDHLTQDWLLDASEIEVQVSGGEVTLDGLVADRSDKRRAEDIADHIPGVTHVQNNLRIRQSAQAQAFGRQPSDETY